MCLMAGWVRQAFPGETYPSAPENRASTTPGPIRGEIDADFTKLGFETELQGHIELLQAVGTIPTHAVYLDKPMPC